MLAYDTVTALDTAPLSCRSLIGWSAPRKLIQVLWEFVARRRR